MIYNNLGTCEETLAANAKTDGFGFNEVETVHLNCALKYSLKFLHLAQSEQGNQFNTAASAYRSVACLCVAARLHKHFLYYAGQAYLCSTIAQGPDHPDTAMIKQLWSSMGNSHPLKLELKLEPEVADALSRKSSTNCCDREGCKNVQTSDNVNPTPAGTLVIIGARTAVKSKVWLYDQVFNKCGACKAVKYCSAECQKLSWPWHKKRCKFAKQVQKELRSQKDSHSELKHQNKKLQRELTKLNATVPVVNQRDVQAAALCHAARMELGPEPEPELQPQGGEEGVELL
jgi:hypothetical protein